MQIAPSAAASNARSRRFREHIEAIHAYRAIPGIDPEPYWPGMWMWDLVSMPPKTSRASIDRIISAVCALYDVSKPEMLSPSRHAIAIRARHVACYLARRMTRLSFEGIGNSLNRDHTTTLYAYNKIKSEMRINQTLAAEVAKIARGFT